MQTTKASNTGTSNYEKKSYVVLEDLPRHPAPKTNHSKLFIRGAVRKPISISLERLRSMTMVKLTADFKCLEGWVVREVAWEGVSVRSILQIAGLKKSAHFLLFSSGDYTYAMNLKEALRITTVLALKQSGRWIAKSRGGPIRLVLKGHNCYESVKSVTMIDVLTKQPADTARDIALSRIRTG